MCDEDGNCSVLKLVHTAAIPPPSSSFAALAAHQPLLRIDCTEPEVVAALRQSAEFAAGCY